MFTTAWIVNKNATGKIARFFLVGNVAKAPIAQLADVLKVVVHSQDFVTILGPGQTKAEYIEEVLHLAPVLVAADGGAERALRLGHTPQAVIGDFDSISDSVRKRIPESRLHRIDEQDSTDFEKCLSRIEAPLVLATGFSGGRLDHELAVLSVLARRIGPPCILVSDSDVIFAAPPRLTLELPLGTRLSLFPMGSVQGHGVGLEWPIDGIPFHPSGRIGTSNRVTGPVSLAFEGDGMLAILPRAQLSAAIAALTD